MMYTNETIPSLIAERQGDDLALAHLAIDATTYALNTAHVYDVAVNRQLYQAFVQGSYEYEGYLYNRKRDQETQDKLIHDFRSACCRLTMQENYSASFVASIEKSFDQTLVPLAFSGNYKQAILDEKIIHLRKGVQNFLDDYDPHHLLLKKRKNDTEIVKVHTMLQGKKESDGVAYYHFAKQKICFNRWVENVPEDKKEADKNKKHISRAVKKNDFHSDRSEKHHHVQCLKSGVRLLSACKQEDTTIGVLAHELVHLVVRNLNDFYYHSPQKAEDIFHFTKQDHDLQTINEISYNKLENDHYWNNKEEVFARQLQRRVVEKFNAYRSQ